MGDLWAVYANNQVLPVRQSQGLSGGWGREVAFFALNNRIGSEKVLRINEVRCGDGSPVAKSASVSRYTMYRVKGIVTGSVEVRAFPFSDFNSRLPSEIRIFYAYQSPLALPPNNALSKEQGSDWERLLPALPYLNDEAVNISYIAPAIDEIAGYLSLLTCVYSAGHNSEIQRMTIREGESLVLATYDATVDDTDFRLDIIVIFEVSDS